MWQKATILLTLATTDKYYFLSVFFCVGDCYGIEEIRSGGGKIE
jgi:hypothetical protein